MAELLGYRDSAFGQLQFPNGCFASSLFDFFRDNPAAVDAVVNWVLEEGETRDGEDIHEEYEEENDEDDPDRPRDSGRDDFHSDG